jgi:hypothetical protein
MNESGVKISEQSGGGDGSELESFQPVFELSGEYLIHVLMPPSSYVMKSPAIPGQLTPSFYLLVVQGWILSWVRYTLSKHV